MKRSSYLLVIFSCLSVMFMAFTDAQSLNQAGISAEGFFPRAFAERSLSVQAQMQGLQVQTRQSKAELQTLQSQLNVAMREHRAALSSKPRPPQGNNVKAWQAYDKALKESQARIIRTQTEVNRLLQMITDKQSEIPARQKGLQQLHASASAVQPEMETRMPPQAVRLPGSRIPGDPRGMLDD